MNGRRRSVEASLATSVTASKSDEGGRAGRPGGGRPSIGPR